MYSNNKNVLQLIALLKAYAVENAVLCPGSRNAAITCSLAGDADFTCHTVVDERSAGFYALGIALRQGETVAVCCTSGTAALNLAPAVAEAYYQKQPLVVITADRPAAWIGQRTGQTLPQPGLYGTLVRKSVNLPEIHTAEDEWYSNRLLNEALMAACDPDTGLGGPVHINIPLPEPLFDFTVAELPAGRVIRTVAPVTMGMTHLGDLPASFLRARKRMFLIGQMVMGDDVGMFLNELAAECDCAVLAEYLSNVGPEACIGNFDALLYALPKERWEAFAPDLLITMGGGIVSKRVKKLLRMYPPKEHWHVSPEGEVVDTYQCLTTVVKMTETEFILSLKGMDRRPGGAEKEYHRRWAEASQGVALPHVPYSDLYAVDELLRRLPRLSSLHLANSSSVRLAQLCELGGGSHSILCNRGTSGIDGCLSTAVGYAAGGEEQVILVTGDLAFFYDMNALWNAQIGSNLRILLNNNGGGGIFCTLPGLEPTDAVRKYVAASHATSAAGWAAAAGFAYLPVRNAGELQESLPRFLGESDRPVLMEVFTSKDDDARILKDYYHSLKQ